MGILNNSNAISVDSGYDITDSLRFRSSASAYLNRTPSSDGNRKTFTVSMWVKRGTLGVEQKLITAHGGNDNNGYFELKFNSSDQLYFGVYTTGSTSAAVFRDPSSWYHVVLKVDTTQASSANRVKVYVNNTDHTVDVGGTLTQNTDLAWNRNVAHSIGRDTRDTNKYIDGYITEVHNVDGTALAPTDFGESDSNGTWIPKKYTGTYGTNGFYLPMKPTTQATGFNTVTYTGNGGTQDITGVGFTPDLVWIKGRSVASGYITGHSILDTIRGASNELSSNTTNAEGALNNSLYGDMTSFNSNGFTVGSESDVNGSGEATVSWTFRKAPKFFDVVTWNGNGTAGRQIAHNLNTTVGCLIVKNTANSGGNQAWRVFNRGRSGEQGRLNETTSFSAEVNTFGNGTTAIDPTSSVFTVGADTAVNGNNRSYVAYLFAHNDGDGGFGETGDQDIIKCGSFAHNFNGAEVSLGFEPQWVLLKAVTQSNTNWYVFDTIRGVVTGGFSGDGDAALFPNTSGAENVNTWGVDVTSTGFKVYGNNILSSGNAIYVAIRRGPMKALENATDVFAIESYTGTGSAGNRSTNILVDAIISARPSTVNNKYALDRMRGGTEWLRTETTEAEGTQSTAVGTFGNNFLEMLGNGATINSSSFDYVNYLLRRSPEFFDIVAYTGDGTTAQTITHNLNGVPKMIWGKRRDNTGNWMVYYGSTLYAVFLNSNTNFTGISPFQNIPHNYQALSSDSQFAVGLASGGNADKSMNTSGAEYVLYIFGEQTGISKIGTYSGTGSNVDVDCGFSSGARFVMIKNVTAGVSGDWNFMDTTKGIDDYMKFNSTDAEATLDLIDIINSGFRVKTGGGSQTNASGNTYFFYAIA